MLNLYFTSQIPLKIYLLVLYPNFLDGIYTLIAHDTGFRTLVLHAHCSQLNFSQNDFICLLLESYL